MSDRKIRVYRLCWFVTGGLLVLYISSPVLLPMIAFSLANACGCQLNEEGSHPCCLAGIDIGGLLDAMLFWVWSFIVVIPTGLIALGTFVGVSFGVWPKLWPRELK